jgi:WD40 repeat protein
MRTQLFPLRASVRRRLAALLLTVPLAFVGPGSRSVLPPVEAAAPPPAAGSSVGLECVRVIRAHRIKRRDLTFSPDGRLLASTVDGSLKLWEVRSGKLLGEFAPVGTDVGWAVFVSQGREIAASVGIAEIHILDTRSLKARAVFSAPEGDRYSGLSSPPDGRFLAANGSAVSVWDVARAKLLWTSDFLPESSYLPTAAFAPDGKAIALRTYGEQEIRREIRLCDSVSGKELRRLSAPTLAPRNLIFAPDGQYLAGGARPGADEILLWNPATGQRCGAFEWESRPPRGSERPPKEAPPRIPSGLNSLAFSADGKTLAAAGADGWLRLFEPASGGLRYEGELQAVKICFSPDDALLASLDGVSGEIHLWNWRQPCRAPSPRLTRVELARLWIDLADEDAARAYQAIVQLLAAPGQAVPFLGERIQAIPPGSIARLRRLVADLDADDFDVRRRASQELERAGCLAEAVVRSALAKPGSLELTQRLERLLPRLEKERGPRLRFLRAVEVLERVGSPAALRVLDRLVAGDPEALETQDVRRARDRVVHRGSARSPGTRDDNDP